METEEPARKRKKSEKKRKSKLQKISSDELPAAPLPSETENDVSLPPVPMEQSTSSAEIAPLLPPNVNDSGDSELDLSSLMADKLAESANDSVDDCVLPTVPSLADMLSQSDICSSIASAGSSIDDGENISQDGQISSSTLQVVIKSEPKESTYDVMNSGSKSPIVSMCPHASSPISHNHPDKVNDGTSTLLLDDQTIVNESGCETSADQTHMHDQAQLDAHAHELLDSVSGTSIAANESTTKENTDDNLNGEGYTLMSRHILKDVVPKSRYEELPEGWKELVHETGLPLYCHLKTRVVTWSRPYFLADRYAKTHPVPVGAIPCMIYKRCKEMMGSECNTDSKQISHKEKETPNTVDAGNATQSSVGTSQDVSNPGQSSIDVKAEPVSSETDKVDSRADHVQQSANEQAEDGETCVDDTQPASAFTELDAEAFMDYCKPVFIFEKKEFKKFNSWKKRKEFEKNDKIKKFVQAGEKDSSMSPVVIPVSEVPEQYQRDDKGKLKRDFYSVPGTHTVMDVYMTYTMWLFRKAPFVEYSPSDAGFECQLKSRTPSVLHGIGIGPTKKAAKEAAAINALESLVPQYAKRLLQNTISYNNDLRERTESSLADYYKLFDAMSITDERVVDAAKDTNQIYPLSTLKECIARNFAMDDSAIKVDTTLDRKGRFITIICDMTVGQFSIKGIKGKNIKMATHYASQNILQQLHPHLKSWGSILRLYGAFAEGSSIALKQESDDLLPLAHEGAENNPSSMELEELNVFPAAVKEKDESISEKSQLNRFNRNAESSSLLSSDQVNIQTTAQTQSNSSSGSLLPMDGKQPTAPSATAEQLFGKEGGNKRKSECEADDECIKHGQSECKVDQSVAETSNHVKAANRTCEQREEGVQTDVGGMDAFYSNKNLKPYVILEEGVTAHENYSTDHGSFILLANASAQTITVGHSTFHKATQMPEMSYNPYTNKNVIKPPDSHIAFKLEPPTDASKDVSTTGEKSLSGTSVVLQTDSTGVSKLHKATQHPDKEYLDPGHPPPAPPVFWPDQQLLQLQQQQLLHQQLALQQQQQVQQLQQPLQYYFVDQNTGLPLLTPPSQQYATEQTQQSQLLAGQQQQQQQWPFLQQQPYTGYEQP